MRTTIVLPLCSTDAVTVPVAGGDEEKIHGMDGRVSRESENQQNRSEEKQGDRGIKLTRSATGPGLSTSGMLIDVHRFSVDQDPLTDW
jgi:hypothetical protein